MLAGAKIRIRTSNDVLQCSGYSGFKVQSSRFKSNMATNKRVLYVGGLAEEVDEKILQVSVN